MIHNWFCQVTIAQISLMHINTNRNRSKMDRFGSGLFWIGFGSGLVMPYIPNKFYSLYPLI